MNPHLHPWRATFYMGRSAVCFWLVLGGGAHQYPWLFPASWMWWFGVVGLVLDALFAAFAVLCKDWIDAALADPA